MNYNKFRKKQYEKYKYYADHKGILKYWKFKRVCHYERKWNCAHDEFVRPARKYRNLRSSYDDYWPSRYIATSWKDRTKHKKQYEK